MNSLKTLFIEVYQIFARYNVFINIHPFVHEYIYLIMASQNQTFPMIDRNVLMTPKKRILNAQLLERTLDLTKGVTYPDVVYLRSVDIGNRSYFWQTSTFPRPVERQEFDTFLTKYLIAVQQEDGENEADRD